VRDELMNSSADVSIGYKPSDAIAYYGTLAAGWESRYERRSFRARLEAIEECLRGRLLVGTQWLDAGCGTGTLTRFLAEKGCSVTGLDAAPKMIEMARLRTREHPLRDAMQFSVAGQDDVGTIERLSNAMGSLDGILCSSVLEYLPDPEQILKEFARVLKPGGILLISVPNAQSVVRRGQVGLHHLGRSLGRPWLPFLEYSRHEFSTVEFEALLRGNSFRAERVIVFGSPIPRWLQRLRFGGSLLMFAAVHS
jgi:2-polyprenyl-6-hydroxyphenyl methylase/3-demethylubiquinone-9 3-methyltransferase